MVVRLICFISLTELVRPALLHKHRASYTTSIANGRLQVHALGSSSVLSTVAPKRNHSSAAEDTKAFAPETNSSQPTLPWDSMSPHWRSNTEGLYQFRAAMTAADSNNFTAAVVTKRNLVLTTQARRDGASTKTGDNAPPTWFDARFQNFLQKLDGAYSLVSTRDDVARDMLTIPSGQSRSSVLRQVIEAVFDRQDILIGLSRSKGDGGKNAVDHIYNEVLNPRNGKRSAADPSQAGLALRRLMTDIQKIRLPEKVGQDKTNATRPRSLNVKVSSGWYFVTWNELASCSARIYIRGRSFAYSKALFEQLVNDITKNGWGVHQAKIAEQVMDIEQKADPILLYLEEMEEADRLAEHIVDTYEGYLGKGSDLPPLVARTRKKPELGVGLASDPPIMDLTGVDRKYRDRDAIVEDCRPYSLNRFWAYILWLLLLMHLGNEAEATAETYGQAVVDFCLSRHPPITSSSLLHPSEQHIESSDVESFLAEQDKKGAEDRADQQKCCPIL